MAKLVGMIIVIIVLLTVVRC